MPRPVFETEHFYFSPMNSENCIQYVEPHHTVWSSKEAMKYCGFQPSKSLKQSKRWIGYNAEPSSDDRLGMYLVFWKEGLDLLKKKTSNEGKGEEKNEKRELDLEGSDTECENDQKTGKGGRTVHGALARCAGSIGTKCYDNQAKSISLTWTIKGAFNDDEFHIEIFSGFLKYYWSIMDEGKVDWVVVMGVLESAGHVRILERLGGEKRGVYKESLSIWVIRTIFEKKKKYEKGFWYFDRPYKSIR